MTILSRSNEKSSARWYPLIEHPVQLALVNDRVRFKVVPAGRRCLPEGTLVATPAGPVEIQKLRIGDIVIGYTDKPEITTVTAIWDNGVQDVISLCSSNREIVAATASHKFLACKETSMNHYVKVRCEDITKRYRIKQEHFHKLINGGDKRVDNAYSLGAFLGNGCCKEKGRKIYLSDPCENIIRYIAKSINCSYSKCKGNNYTWAFNSNGNCIKFFEEWSNNRYSHEKIASWDEIDTWDKDSALSFLAGVIDTDGSLYYKYNGNKREAVLNISMQSESIVRCCSNIIHKFFQEELSISVDDRDKYVNGVIYSGKTTSNWQFIRIIDGIDKYLIKRKGFDCSLLSMRNKIPGKIGLVQKDNYLSRTYDITVANETNLYCLHNGIVTSNSGKTERAKRFVVREAMSNPDMSYFFCAPTRDQVKRIYWNDIKLMSFSHLFGRNAVSESELSIKFPNGSTIGLVGLDKPERIEGIQIHGLVLDEIDNIKPEAWPENISPAIDTIDPTRPDYKAWCWLIGVPEGLQLLYDRAQYAETSNDPDWALYHWKSAEILPIEVIEAAKKRMSLRQFKQEYEASFELATGRIYSDYGKENWTGEVIQRHEQLLWAHDFNYTPMSSCVSVRRGDDIYVLDEIILESAIARQSALEFVDKFSDHDNKNVIVFGDPAGRAGEKHGHASDYVEIENVLRDAGWKFKRLVKAAAPAIRDRQNEVRAKIRNAEDKISLFVNPSKAKYVDQGLSRVARKKGSSFQEEESEFSHVTTAIGYQIDYLFPIKRDVESKPARPIKTVHHWG